MARFTRTFACTHWLTRLPEEFENQVVDPESLCHMILRSGMVLSRFDSQSWDILRPMFAGTEKKWADDNRASRLARRIGVRGRDGRLGNLHMCRLDDLVLLLNRSAKSRATSSSMRLLSSRREP